MFVTLNVTFPASTTVGILIYLSPIETSTWLPKTSVLERSAASSNASPIVRNTSQAWQANEASQRLVVNSTHTAQATKTEKIRCIPKSSFRALRSNFIDNDPATTLLQRLIRRQPKCYPVGMSISSNLAPGKLALPIRVFKNERSRMPQDRV